MFIHLNQRKMFFVVLLLLFGSYIYFIAWDVLCFFMNSTRNIWFNTLLFLFVFFLFFFNRNSHRACTPWNCGKMKKTQQIITKGEIFPKICLILFVCRVLRRCVCFFLYFWFSNVYHECGAIVELWMFCFIPRCEYEWRFY